MGEDGRAGGSLETKRASEKKGSPGENNDSGRAKALGDKKRHKSERFKAYAQ